MPEIAGRWPMISPRHAALNGVLAGAVAIFLGLLAVNRFGPDYAKGDTLIQSVISLQHVTLFYWGQNRFANLVPALLSPVTSPSLNAFLLMWVYSAAFFGLIAILAFGVSKRLMPATTWGDCWLCFVLLCALSLWCLCTPAAAMFTVLCLPWAISALFFTVAALILFSPGLPWWQTALGYVSLFVALGLNPSLLLVGCATAIAPMVSTVRLRDRVIFVSVTAVFFIAWTLLSLTAPESNTLYFDLARSSLYLGLTTSAREILSAFDLLYVAGAVALCSVLRSIGTPSALVARVAGFLLGGAFIWWLIFAANRWVEENAYGVRYFSIVLLVVLSVLAYLLVDLLVAMSSPTKLAATGACAILTIIPLLRPLVDWRDYRDIKQARAFVDVAEHNDIHFIAGSYRTDIWATVLLLMDDGYEAFGLADRAEGNGEKLTAAIARDISQGHAPRALCLEATAICIATASRLTSMAWTASSERCEAPGCTIIRAADVGSK